MSRKNRNILIVLVGLFLTGFSPLMADVVVLPFRVQGRPDPALFHRQDLPGELQAAVHFLFGIKKQYPRRGLDRTNLILRRMKWRSDFKLDRTTLLRVCKRTRGTYVISGGIRFITTRRIRMKMSSYSCSWGRQEGRSEKTGNISRMQQIMGRLIGNISLFSENRVLTLRPVSSGGAAVDVAVVLDLSGSMIDELPGIKRALSYNMRKLPGGSRISVMGVRSRGETAYLPFTGDGARLASFFRPLQAHGEVYPGQLKNALHRIQTRFRWRNKRKLIFITDTSLDRKSRSRLERSLQKIRRQGVKISIYAPSGRPFKSRTEYSNLAQSLRIKKPELLAARKVKLNDGSFFYIIQKDNRFFKSSRNVIPEIQHNRLNKRGLIPIELFRFDRSSLNLNDLPQKYVQKSLQAVTNLGPISSGLEKQISGDILAGNRAATVPYLVLVKNQGHSFWVRLNSRNKFHRLQRLRGKSVALGLRFLSGGNAAIQLKNHPDHVYIKKSGQAPALFVNNSKHLLKLPAGMINSNDIWFLQVKVLGFRDVQKEKDIRE